MELDVVMPQKVKAKYVRVHVKVVDQGSYSLRDPDGEKIADVDGYVPGFFPEDHYGDYLILDIDLDTGQVLNWKKRIDPREVAMAFGLSKEDE